MERDSDSGALPYCRQAKAALIDAVPGRPTEWPCGLILRCARIASSYPFQPDRGLPLPLYLTRFSYSTDAVKALINQPQDRSAAAREVAESLDCKLVGFWYAFGEFDGVFLLEAPDNPAAAAVAMAVGASGALSEVETTVLLDMDEAQDAMRKAAAATYRPPHS
jgi:uncharacterized protein with GYD domain